MNRWHRNIAGKFFVMAAAPGSPGPAAARIALVLDGPGAMASREGKAVRLKMLATGEEIVADVNSFLECEATKQESDAALGL